MPNNRAITTGLYDPRFEHDSCGVGFVAHIKGERSHQILQDANTILVNMDHRGACGSEENTGDGAGILTALPHEFFERAIHESLGERLPPPGRLGVGLVFLPTDHDERRHSREVVEKTVEQRGHSVIGWRPVPTNPDAADIGPAARHSEPVIEQLFVAAGSTARDETFERELYLIRKRVSHRLRDQLSSTNGVPFYICSLSSRVIIYKGMLRPAQLLAYFPDLADAGFTTHLAMVHSRFSTNTFPSWDRAQPNRFMAHNGEINTLLGNVNWMRAREGVMHSDLFKEELDSLYPVVEPDCSDSGNFDNVLEFLLMTGRTLQESIMMMIPEAWQKHGSMDSARRAFYEYHSCLMEPWDGPASIAFTDGRYIGAVLDRNGLRPSRYYLTTDDRVIMASEVGVLPVDPEKVKEKGRLHPGKMFLVDFEQGRMIPDQELKQQISTLKPYAEWMERQRIDLGLLSATAPAPLMDKKMLIAQMRTFGFTVETLQFMLLPLIEQTRDPVGSMGNDSTLACLSDQPRLVYDYFKQLFAQVTNPAIDSIREDVIMSLECYIGPERNLLEPGEEHCHRLRIVHPILTNEELIAIREISRVGWRTTTLDTTFPREEGADGLVMTLQRICREAETAVDAGAGILLLSDRATSAFRVPVSALMICGAVHHHLVRAAKRTRVAIIIESGECREVHHHCLLVGYGADAINPYLVYEVLQQALRDDLIDQTQFNDTSAIEAYRTGVAKGILKVMGKMGISTLQSYKGAQIFEALGLKDEVIDLCFGMTPSRLQGAGFEVLAHEMMRRYELGFPTDSGANGHALPNPGEFHWRAGGEHHGWAPYVIADLQTAARTNSPEAYRRFATSVNDEARKRSTLRGLFQFSSDKNGGSIDPDEVEAASEIVKRFCTGAMSFGSISGETHETLAIAMNRLGGRSNTGEGGEDPARFIPMPNGDSRRSAIKQVASGRFGVTAWYLTNANELQIKIAQGAKPGEGGELPGQKVD
ncbi:MAG: glutamate synthase central domain-containing protein, partial [Pseudomonadota bacterium]|nr:glutamate synthase central domain-containing protein [Pseudomonadota bacterium]